MYKQDLARTETEQQQCPLLIKSSEGNLRDPWDNVKCPNNSIIGVPGEEDKEKGHEKILEELIVENLS